MGLDVMGQARCCYFMLVDVDWLVDWLDGLLWLGWLVSCLVFTCVYIY